MIDHVSIAVADLGRAAAFYEAVLAPLGLSRLVTRERTIGFGKRYPEFWLNLRPETRPVANPGAHVCLRAPDAEAVQAFHAAALRLGGTDEGMPGERGAAMTTYFAAFVVDPDGNKIEAACFPRT
ncbi:VOC family protein [Neoroseomonas soli]|uniref:VOC family protein n=1 Tax=Neoroseomonas soli TaxID=1081025 RepID=A0A9X9WZZ9_9PROT|nr:VOC family protein [Neoroseomonas soli]MBR0672728.1 VOC family protein [Neoroseomonas soli]